MKLLLVGHDDRYALEQLQLALFPGESMEPVDDPFEGDGTVSTLHRGKQYLTAVAKVTKNGKTTTASRRLRADRETVPLRRRILQQSLYTAALPHLPNPPAWGALAGVRPTKLTTRHLLDGGSPTSAKKMMEDTYFVSPQRAKLAVDCSLSTVDAIHKLEPKDLSLYIGIPFCPTRCSYCSFVSRTIGKQGKLLEQYLHALLEEIAFTGALLESAGYSVRTLYIGGGTPTTLSTPQMVQLMEAIHKSFDLSRCLEFTVEGGRPDTLDLEKLTAIRSLGADRMSINPQSMVDSVLKASGRPHIGADIERAYRQAVDAGFRQINMDLIAGLPTDTLDGFRYSLDTVTSLDPSNVTVHTLALKKGADLFENPKALPSGEEVLAMVRYSQDLLDKLGYHPYYLYRQKYMSGSFENVGWSKPGTDCLYNIYMMEELHTILSLGGGGMSKLQFPDGHLTRFHNPKFPEQYISMLEQVKAEKETMFRQMKGCE